MDKFKTGKKHLSKYSEKKKKRKKRDEERKIIPERKSVQQIEKWK